MHMRLTAGSHRKAAAFMLALLLCRGAAGADPISGPEAEHARRILSAAGVRGGLVVHLGCGDGKLTATLCDSDSYLVHGLDANPANVDNARSYIRSLGLYGRVSVERWTGERLPYADNLVNLLVISDASAKIAEKEIQRVLAPRGTVISVDPKSTIHNPQSTKPWPKDIDEWTHWLHAADGNAVARDRVAGPLGRFQWAAEPLWSRHHDTVPSTSAMVSSGGRLFYISDEAPAGVDGSLPDKWFLVARDAFNGVLLWKQPIRQWGWNQWSAEWQGRFNIPPHLPKRLVAAGDHVYATLNFNAPLSALDAATGKVLRVYEGTENTDEILYRDGLLILALNQEARTPDKNNKEPVKKSVCVVEADSGRMLWKTGSYVGLRAKYSSAEPFGRLELAAGGEQVFLADQDALVSLELKSGQQRWRIPRPPFEEQLIMYNIRMSDQCVLVYQDGTLLFAQPEMDKKRSWHTIPGTLYAYHAQDGRPLWKHRYGGWGHNWQPDVFVIGGLVWVHEHQDVDFPGHEPTKKDNIDYAVIGLDLKTGEQKQRFSTRETFNVGHHHRCYRGKATERFLLASRRGVELVDLATGENQLHHWARAGCLHGFVPCNGMVYLSPHPCECYIATKLNGYCALAPQSAAAPPESEPLEKGPAYSLTPNPQSLIPNPSDWPTFRHDAARSGWTTAVVPSELRQAWRTHLGGRLSPPVAAGGKIFVAAIDGHQVAALDAVDGKTLWTFTAGGRIDTPPTVYQGRVLCGCADGWVYCLSAADGRLAWRRRAAPESRRVGAFGQLESAWPVHGSLLVQDGVAYLAAGRSSYLDGGIFLYGLDPATGEVLRQRTLYSPDPQTGAMPPGDARTIPGALADILVSDGSGIYMRQEKVFGDDNGRGRHLVSTAGLRDDAWFNRTEWAIGAVAGAQLLVFDDQTAYGVAAYSGTSRGKFFHPGDNGYQLFAASWQPRGKPGAEEKPAAAKGKKSQPRWTVRVPVRATAMVLAGGTLLAAGTPDVVDPFAPLAAFEGRGGGRLRLISTDDGSKLAEYELQSPPVYDGMAVAGGRLYMTTASGHAVCFAAGRSDAQPIPGRSP
jgi:outer membrane protein assembly factor BamB